ncbi:MAG TPA: glycogen debranching protein GlgX [Candidatus Hydrogenedentes bacterium]|nr:glycogen debranching protein GlgX [Candidatus Hydrogenedentota bacterium]HPG67571.1 glycogen debranching protein GlgX [Candidatus Hydrogenedentota bacterium]
MLDRQRLDRKLLHALPGHPYPLGAWVQKGGVRFVVFSRHATRVSLLLFESADDMLPAVELPFDPERHRTGDIWSLFVQGLDAGTIYAYRMDGPFDPESGHRFDADRTLLDPYATVLVGDVSGGHGKCLVVDDDAIWFDEPRREVEMDRTIIYETHVRGLTVHPSSGVACPGTYLGLIEKIDYLKDLGVTAVDLLPVHEVGERGLGRFDPQTHEELRNYWGYNTIGFFAPTDLYTTSPGEGLQLVEFREMVGALHSAGIEVILDVVFNHTAEGNHNGRTLSFRGIDNAIYYLLDEQGQYLNFSGCGNTMNCNHPLVRQYIIDSLQHWVTSMHVDGFRFDLASILGRDRKGRVVENAPLIETIAEDPLLRRVKLIAEAWDAGGAYQVGSFGDGRWAEWNGRFRDDVRRFWRGDAHTRSDFASRLTGSSDLYQKAGRSPVHSINFVTAHDGFTLRDLVSYNEKHNLDNGENNADGQRENFSWNCGVEGETDDPAINALRVRMRKNHLAALFLSLGVPMMLGGDEFGRTQRGNNNAYCQDNAISWYDWTLLEANRDLHRFCREAIRFRRENPVFMRKAFFTGQPVRAAAHPDILWFDASGRTPQWHESESDLACRIDGSVNAGTSLYLMFNPSDKKLLFRVPEGRWSVRIDTAASPPDDIVSMHGLRAGSILDTYPVSPRSMAVLSSNDLIA